tara:strand:- start:579 stop:836 length:258 start_codon:yes stop_codon:yes gene_type:complete
MHVDQQSFEHQYTYNQAETDQHTAPRIEDGYRQTVLAVEDDPVSLKFITAQVEAMGHDVVSAENGQQAYEILKARKGEIHSVIMD